MLRQNSLLFVALAWISLLIVPVNAAPSPLSFYVIPGGVHSDAVNKGTVAELQERGILLGKAALEIHALVSVQLSPQKSISRLMNADGTARETEVINGYAVAIELTPEDGKKFAGLTTSNVGHQILIALNGKVLMAPFVQEPILGPKLQIFSSKKEDAESMESLLQLLVTK